MTLSQSVLATLSYHDIFDYPLNIQEIEKYLIWKKSGDNSLQNELKNLVKEKKIGLNKNYYYLKNRKSIVSKRARHKSYSIKKYKIALFYSKLLKLVPTIKFVAITGALSMQNCTFSDDIDLMIITTKNNIWITRALANLILIFFKRNPQSQKKSGRACLNIFLDEQDLKIKDKNLYTAHEIVQINILWDKDNMSKKFFKANNWISTYLPNFQPIIGESSMQKIKFKFPKIAENISKFIQQKYMHSKITTEIIGEKQLFFHPKATQSKILSIYQQKLTKLQIATNSRKIDNK